MDKFEQMMKNMKGMASTEMKTAEKNTRECVTAPAVRRKTNVQRTQRSCSSV